MKKRLFDFSAAGAVLAIVAYGLLLTLFGYTFFASGQKPIFAVVVALLLVSFCFLLFYFVVLSVKLEEDGIRQGQKRIGRQKIQCRTEYSLRFREGQIILRDQSLDYTELNAKQKKKKTIRIQATKSNLRKISEYLGKEISAPQKPKRKRKQQREEQKHEDPPNE